MMRKLESWADQLYLGKTGVGLLWQGLRVSVPLLAFCVIACVLFAVADRLPRAEAATPQAWGLALQGEDTYVEIWNARKYLHLELDATTPSVEQPGHIHVLLWVGDRWEPIQIYPTISGGPWKRYKFDLQIPPFALGPDEYLVGVGLWSKVPEFSSSLPHTAPGEEYKVSDVVWVWAAVP